MPADDKAQQPAGDRSLGMRMRPHTWLRRIANRGRHADAERQTVAPLPERLDVRAALRALPALLDSSSLPNGVVELVIEDLEAPARQLIDIHDGRVTPMEPGQCVPWASIAGQPTAWALALGAESDPAALQIAGDEQLARRVLAALQHRVEVRD